VGHGQVRFAHRFIDGGADLIYGHSSHHPSPVEVYRGRLVLSGCGDAINDYQGTRRYQEFRGDLRLLYFASVAADTGTLAALRMVPMQARKMRPRHASAADSQRMQAVLILICAARRGGCRPGPSSGGTRATASSRSGRPGQGRN
jgi:poly-gamma-glutamate capsule biosynthesis protein CapA/YwtB (metallophosphatase superfamily)